MFFTPASQALANCTGVSMSDFENHARALENLCIPAFIAQQARANPGAIAIEALERRPLTYGRLQLFLEQTAECLNSLGIGRQDRAALVLPNGPEMAVAFLAIATSCVAAPLNPAYRVEEFEFCLSELKAGALVVPEKTDSPAREAANRLSIPVLELSEDRRAEAGLFALTGVRRGSPRLKGPAHPGDIALLLHTSGATSRPKLVPLTHANICISARNIARALRLNASDRCLNIMPLFHIHGLVGALLSSLLSGASIVCSPGFIAPLFFEWFEAYQPTWFTAVPTMHQSVLQQAARDGLRPRKQPRLIRSCSAPLPPRVMADLEALFGAPVIESYGMTEASHQITSNPLPPGVRKPGSVGIAAGPELAIVDERGTFLPHGSVGEVVIRGGSVMTSYLDSADASSNAFLRGWFRTGDQGYLDEEGYLFLTGRIKEIINRGGEKISPREIDEVLMEHRAIRQALCFAAPHTLLGEEVAAVVVLREGFTITERELREFAARRLADFKVPRTILFRDEIPTGPTGKLQRIGLAERLGWRFDTPPKEAGRWDQTAPRTAVEERIGDIARQVLRLAAIGVHEDLVRLGADSILIMQLLARVHGVTGQRVPLIRFFENPTVARIAALVEGSASSDATPEPPIIPVGVREGTLPLSFAQERMWFLQMLEPGMIAYNRPILASLHGSVDQHLLELSLTEIISRHESLRTVFPTIGARPVQHIQSPEPVKLRLEDYSNRSAEEWQRLVSLLVREELGKPFDLARGPLFRAVLMRHCDDEHALLLVTHHIVFDDWSEGILLRELGELYRSLRAGESAVLPPIRTQYADFARWQRLRLQGDYLAELLSYWETQLAGLEAADIVTDRPRPQVQTYRGARWSTVLPGTLVESLRELCRREGVTLFMAMLACFQILLRRSTGRDDIVVGTPVAERDHPETAGLIGILTNSLVLRTDLAGNPTFSDLLRRTRQTVNGALVHHELPFEKIVEALKPERNLARTPLFQILFEFRNVPRRVIRGPDLEIRPCRPDTGIARFDLSIDIAQEEGNLLCAFDYNADLFERATIERLSGQFSNLLRDAVAHPDNRLSELRMLSEDEEQRILAQWSRSPEKVSTQGSLDRLFEAQALRTPEAIAATFRGQTITYADLNRDANRWASRLRSIGIELDQPVGICMNRSFDMLAGILGILKAGGACVPLDPLYPEERLILMAAETGLQTILTQHVLADRLRSTDAGLAFPEDLRTESLVRDAGIPSSLSSEDHLAYLIFTSGSTGRPKAVAMPHGVLVNLISWQVAKPGFAMGRKTLQFASLSFDVAFQEMFSTWASGGSLALISEEMQRDLIRLWRLIDDEQVERLFVPFVALQSLAEVAEIERRYPKRLREIITAGEQLRITPQIRSLFQELPDCALENQYGPAETHVVTYHAVIGPVQDWPILPPIGRPIAGAEVYILDEFRQPVPQGVAGEIYVGGPVLARGYLNRADLTAERFIASPFGHAPEQRLYRTGDLARFREGGNIEYLGRRDRQVKVRGFRVECGEIEAALDGHPDVRQSVVSTWSDESGATRLVAYLISKNKTNPTESDLTQHLRTRLPAHMIPAAFVFLDQLPLLPNGKINYRALTPPTSLERQRVLPPRTPGSDLERTIAGLWQEVLGVNRVGSDDNVFDLGGDSLRLIQIYSRLKAKVHGEFSIIHMFQYPTVAEFARFLENSADDSDVLGGTAQRAKEQRAAFKRRRRSPGRSIGEEQSTREP